jgi:TolA-binding protein
MVGFSRRKGGEGYIVPPSQRGLSHRAKHKNKYGGPDTPRQYLADSGKIALLSALDEMQKTEEVVSEQQEQEQEQQQQEQHAEPSEPLSIAAPAPTKAAWMPPSMKRRMLEAAAAEEAQGAPGDSSTIAALVPPEPSLRKAI